jgi:transketolase
LPLTPSAAGAKALDAREIRRIILEQSKRAHVGHIGSALSVADIVAVLYGGVLRIEHPDNPNRDRFVLSKGHAALALYAAFHLRGWLSQADLDTYCGNNSLLGVHPDAALTGVDFTTGSLGHGLSYAAGAALAARSDGSSRRVYALLSDAECNEGAVWETALFAAHHKLSNLIAVVDVNGQQALGHTANVLSLHPLREKWAAFGWETIEVDGHDHARLESAFTRAGDSPRVVLAATTFGKGVSFMQSRIEWHYLPMSDVQFAEAMAEVMAL